MSDCATLLELYQEWRKWTETEGEAILSNDWRQVSRCQAAKTELQPRILKQTDLAQAECARDGIDRKSFEKQVRSRVNELIYLETRNAEFLAEQRESTRAEYDALERSGRNLPKIQRRYASGAGAGWESYS
ncbi:MAG TPA: hypothetical protein VI282_03720 [Verrucomicrobiae bacterium]|jgi:hypothetical protein